MVSGYAKSKRCDNCGQWSFEKDAQPFILNEKIDKALALLKNTVLRNENSKEIKEAIEVLKK